MVRAGVEYAKTLLALGRIDEEGGCGCDREARCPGTRRESPLDSKHAP